MSVRVTNNTVQISRATTQKANIALRLIAEEIVRVSEPKTPKKRGSLRRDVLKQVLGLHGTIQWRKKYAARQETRQARNYTTPGTGPHYAENAVRRVVTRSGEFFRKAGL